MRPALFPLFLALFLPAFAHAGEKKPSTAAIEAKILTLINAYRKEHNLPALAADETIARQARQHSADMGAGRSDFGHDGFGDRVDVIRKTIRARAWAENVARNWGSRDVAAAAVKSWLGSSSHLDNIEGDFDLTGIGAARGADGKWYFTQIFIRRARPE